MEIIIAGANLKDQSKGQFQIHKPGCRHIKLIGGDEDWTMNSESKREIVFEIYEDQIDEGCDYNSAYGDIFFAPCVDGLTEN